jgi:hypothetical protein
MIYLLNIAIAFYIKSSYCYHLVIVIIFSQSQSGHIKWLPLIANQIIPIKAIARKFSLTMIHPSHKSKSKQRLGFIVLSV